MRALSAHQSLPRLILQRLNHWSCSAIHNFRTSRNTTSSSSTHNWKREVGVGGWVWRKENIFPTQDKKHEVFTYFSTYKIYHQSPQWLYLCTYPVYTFVLPVALLPVLVVYMCACIHLAHTYTHYYCPCAVLLWKISVSRCICTHQCLSLHCHVCM